MNTLYVYTGVYIYVLPSYLQFPIIWPPFRWPSIFPIQCQLLPIRAMDVGELGNFPGPVGSWPMGQNLPLEGYGMHPMKTMVIIMVLEL